MDIQLFHQHLLKRFFLYSITLAHFLRIGYTYNTHKTYFCMYFMYILCMYVGLFLDSILFHWSVYQHLHKYHIILIILALSSDLKWFKSFHLVLLSYTYNGSKFFAFPCEFYTYSKHAGISIGILPNL